MKVEIRSIRLKTKYVSNAPDEVVDPNLRSVTVVEKRSDGTAAQKEIEFVLPAVEVDHQLIVGGIYELVFARRES